MQRLVKVARRLFGAGAAAPAHRLPDGVRIYAIGDVHGCLDPLRRLEDVIARSARGHEHQARVVFLGDYIDRGPEVAGVIEHLSRGNFAGLPTRHLLGNHEDIMLQSFEEPSLVPHWLRWGGMATLASYRVVLPQGLPPPERDAFLAASMREALPSHHLAFLESLELSIGLGDYLFVHAGIRPTRPIEKQSRQDMLMIREAFLGSARPLPVRVVHGHSVTFDAQILPHRIGVDTGVYATGKLSCVLIEGDAAEILSVGPRGGEPRTGE